MKDRTAVFIGHSELNGANIKDKLKEEIVKLIIKGVDRFFNGGMGDFDMLSARCINELKKEYPNIKHTLVIPYLNFNRCERNIFDDSIYPELEKYNPRIAIIKRNEYMIENSAFAICYINYSFGGAVKTYEKAKKKKLSIVNLGKY